MTASLVLLGLCQTKCALPGLPITLVNLCIAISVVAIGLLTLGRAFLNQRTLRRGGRPTGTLSPPADCPVAAGGVRDDAEHTERERWK